MQTSNTVESRIILFVTVCLQRNMQLSYIYTEKTLPDVKGSISLKSMLLHIHSFCKRLHIMRLFHVHWMHTCVAVVSSTRRA